jgi:thiamine biosynthesis lipoprotein
MMIKPKDAFNESLQKFQLKAMNTNIDLMLWMDDAVKPSIKSFAENWFHSTEDRFSRFRPKSELNHLNQLAGERCLVSREMLEVLLLSDSYRSLTEGVFDPFILHSLERAGYNQSFDLVKEQEEEQPIKQISPVSLPKEGMSIDSLMNSVQLPPHSKLDLGGIVKSWSVKRLANYLQDKLMLKQGLINAGGDLVVWGKSPIEPEPWLIGIENPWDEQSDIGTLALSDGAVATSSKLGRQWVSNGVAKHHLIDPRTMEPSHSNVAQCTVTGPNVIECEIWAKVICILGIEEGLSLLSRKAWNYEALLFTTEQQTHYYGSQNAIGSKWRELKIDEYHFNIQHSE